MKKSTALMSLAFLCARIPLQAQEAPAKKPGGLGEIFLLFIVPFAVIFYVFFIRPQKKEQKKRKELLGAVAKGDHVRTIGGIFGKVTNINTGGAEETVTILIDEKSDVKMKVLKRAIASIKGKTEDTDDSNSR